MLQKSLPAKTEKVISKKPYRCWLIKLKYCRSKLIREAKYDQKTDELGDKNELIDSLEEQNRLLRIRFNRLKGVFGDH